MTEQAKLEYVQARLTLAKRMGDDEEVAKWGRHEHELIYVRSDEVSLADRATCHDSPLSLLVGGSAKER